MIMSIGCVSYMWKKEILHSLLVRITQSNLEIEKVIGTYKLSSNYQSSWSMGGICNAFEDRILIVNLITGGIMCQ